MSTELNVEYIDTNCRSNVATLYLYTRIVYVYRRILKFLKQAGNSSTWINQSFVFVYQAKKLCDISLFYCFLFYWSEMLSARCNKRIADSCMYARYMLHQWTCYRSKSNSLIGLHVYLCQLSRFRREPVENSSISCVISCVILCLPYTLILGCT